MGTVPSSIYACTYLPTIAHGKDQAETCLILLALKKLVIQNNVYPTKTIGWFFTLLKCTVLKCFNHHVRGAPLISNDVCKFGVQHFENHPDTQPWNGR